MEKETRKGQWQILVGLLVGVACLAAVFIFYARPGEIIETFRHVRPGYLLLGALGIVIFLLIRAVRWRFMLDNSVPFSQVFHIQNIGYMLTQLMPFRLGDVARAILIGNVPPVTIAQGISTMVVERLLDMLFIVVLLPFTLSGITSCRIGCARLPCSPALQLSAGSWCSFWPPISGNGHFTSPTI